MTDLSKSPFLDSGMLSIVRQILSRRTPTIITNDHKYAVEHRDDLIKLNETYDRGLIKILEDCKNYISTADAVVFLLNAQRIGKEEDAKEALLIATQDQVTATRSELRKILKDSKNVPMSWAIIMSGEFADKRYPDRNLSRESSIDTSRFQDFK